jgi:hypothetical protein
MESIDVFAQGTSKRQKLASGGSAQVRFDGVMLNKPPHPAPRATRKSTRATKANSKKGMRELFEQLGEEFQAVAKTCEEILEVLN